MIWRAFLASALLLFGALWCSPSEAANRFWVGGTGTWDNSTTTHWASTTGGAGGVSVPAPGDNVTFDGSSGGGTVTVAATFNASNSLGSLTFGAFTGTLDFSVNNPAVTTTLAGGVSGTGSATRTFKFGSGLWTISGANGGTILNLGTANQTGLTLPDIGSSNIEVTGAATTGVTFGSGAYTFGTVTFDASAAKGALTITGPGATFTTLKLNGFSFIILPGSLTATNLTVSGGSATSPVYLSSVSPSSVMTFTVTNGPVLLDWAILRAIGFTGATITANDSIDLGLNSGVTINAPAGSSHIIGG